MPPTLSNHYPSPSSPSQTPPIPFTMTDPKNMPKIGWAGSRGSLDPKDANADKNESRDKYRTAIPKQSSQTMTKASATDTQRTCPAGNAQNEMWTGPWPTPSIQIKWTWWTKEAMMIPGLTWVWTPHHLLHSAPMNKTWKGFLQSKCSTHQGMWLQRTWVDPQTQRDHG